MGKIIVIGSAAIDFMIETNELPTRGKTVLGKRFNTSMGGKGANQAVAAARMGASVTMIGCVGTDHFSDAINSNLANNQINVDYMERVTQSTAGTAFVILNNQDNQIIVVPGANAELTWEKVAPSLKKIAIANDLVILQNEIPLETNLAIIKFCEQQKISVLYNPAPAKKISTNVLKQITYLTPNEHEFKQLFPNQTLEQILPHYPNKLIVTLGERGVIYNDGSKNQLIPANQVQPVDTTGAGDTFNGAFAASIITQTDLETAIKRGNQAAALSVQAKGAQTGMPTLNAIQEKENSDVTEVE
ncbi:ribokinase [Lapidilactobacillus wuchangensis]|uniref:ribokinase n=1 Tax=Lapidilactobacillus wuchangensis TaxID=2486001 RepID=UPI000F76F370|nr:ribokinase [Lapidilactobacillus wuchangensis]